MTVEGTQIMSRGEIVRILKYLDPDGKKGPWLRRHRQKEILFRLTACCGLRATEVTRLNIDDIVYDHPRPHIRILIGKGKKRRNVPLWWDGATLECIIAWAHFRMNECGDETMPLVTAAPVGRYDGLNKRLSRFRVWAQYKTIAREALGERRAKTVWPHTGRHSFVSHALAGGRSLAEVRDAAGHCNVSITSAYIHIAEDDGGKVGNLFAFDKEPAA
jgi:integrase/recombinase XerD